MLQTILLNPITGAGTLCTLDGEGKFTLPFFFLIICVKFMKLGRKIANHNYPPPPPPVIGLKLNDVKLNIEKH